MLEIFPDPFLGEICGQPAALRRAARGLARQSAQLDRIPTLQPGSPIIFTGMGGSYATCYAPVTALASQGIAAVMVDSAELLYFRRPILNGNALLVIVSQSGESAEVVRLVDQLDGDGSRPFVISLTNGLQNRLSRLADVAIDTEAGVEQGPSTMTFASALLLLAGLADVIAGRRTTDVSERLAEQAEVAARSLERLLESAQANAEHVCQWLGERPILTLLGRGAGRAASEMGALTMKEAARFPAEAMQSAQYRHGPLELAGKESAVVIIATEPATGLLDSRLAAELSESGVAVLWIAPAALDRNGIESVAIGNVEPTLASAAAIVPIQLLAWRLALERGYRPGTYTRASKVTTRE